MLFEFSFQLSVWIHMATIVRKLLSSIVLGPKCPGSSHYQLSIILSYSGSFACCAPKPDSQKNLHQKKKFFDVTIFYRDLRLKKKFSLKRRRMYLSKYYLWTLNFKKSSSSCFLVDRIFLMGTNHDTYHQFNLSGKPHLKPISVVIGSNS